MPARSQNSSGVMSRIACMARIVRLIVAVTGSSWVAAVLMSTE